MKRKKRERECDRQVCGSSKVIHTDLYKRKITLQGGITLSAEKWQICPMVYGLCHLQFPSS